MFRKRILLKLFIFILVIFFSCSLYFIYSINHYNNNGVRSSTTEYSIVAIEHDIRLKAANLPDEYRSKSGKSDIIIRNFIKNIKPNNEVDNLDVLWKEIDSSINDQLFNSNNTNLGNVLLALKTGKILAADTYSKGTQFKLLLTLKGDHLAVFKPQWYEKDRIITGHVYAGKDRYGSEILAFYLAAILNLPLVPIVSERVINVNREILPVATNALNSTTFIRNNKTCIYGICYYCKREDPICTNNGNIRGAVLYHIPGKFQTYNSPWQRTYKQGKKAAWETQANYCSKVKSKISNKRLLDLIDVSIFDFLIQNGDRHHYETLNDKVVLIDNGKGLGNPFVHHIDILAPLYQCCVLRTSTWERLKLFTGGYMEEILRSFEEVRNVVATEHFQAINERINLIYATVDLCRKRNKFLT